MALYIEGIGQLDKELPALVKRWNDEQDPRIPDPNAWKPEEWKKSLFMEKLEIYHF